jgi:hypothetical protein
VVHGLGHDPQHGVVIAVVLEQRPPLIAAVQDVEDHAPRLLTIHAWHGRSITGPVHGAK